MFAWSQSYAHRSLSVHLVAPSPPMPAPPPSLPSQASAGEAPERILVLDPDLELRTPLVRALLDEGFLVEPFPIGLQGLEAARVFRPGVIVLELTLPDMLGTAFCALVRHDPALARTGLLLMSSRGGDEDRIAGLEVGADDYVVKPFNLRELVLRIRALARRCARPPAKRPPAYRWQGLEVDVARHRVAIDGTETTLRPLEFKLLTAMLAAQGTTFSRADLMHLVWGLEGESDSRTVDTHVRRLRDRLGPYGEALETVHRFGYRWREQPLTAATAPDPRASPPR